MSKRGVKVKVVGLLDKNTYHNLFVIGTVCLSVRSVFGLSQMDSYFFRNLTIIAYVLVFIKIIHTEFNKKGLFKLSCALLVAYLVMKASGNSIALGTVFFIFGMQDVDVNKVMKVNAIGLSLATLFIVSMSLMGKVPIMVNSHLSFGFNNPNGLQSFISAITILYIASSIKKIDIICLTFFLLLNFVTSTLVEARMGYLVAVFIFVLILILKRPGHREYRRIFKAETIYLAVVFSTIICVVMYKVIPFIKWLDMLISGRFYQANYYLGKYGVNLWGNKILELESDFKYWRLLLDCGYARLFINYGLVYGVIFVWAHYSVLKTARFRGDMNIIVALLGFAIIMIVENGGIGINFNMSLLLLSEMFSPFADIKKGKYLKTS